MTLISRGVGAVTTDAAMAIILVAKFLSGAWLMVIVIPFTLLLHRIHRYYQRIDPQLCEGADRVLDLRARGEPAVLVPIGGWNRATRKAIEYALGLSNDVTALHVTRQQGEDLDGQARSLRRDWSKFVEQPAHKAGIDAPTLRMIDSQFCGVVAPLLREIEAVHRHLPDRQIFVVLPQVVEDNWWELLRQAHRQRQLQSRLIRYIMT